MAVPVELNCQSELPPSSEKRIYSGIDEALEAVESGHQVDPMELHRLARESQGSLESEFCFGDESNLHTYFNNCTKNPGHHGFISIDELCLENLPEGYRTEEYLQLILCQADLTVKLITYYMSDARPEKWKMRGKKVTSRATGFVFWVADVKAKDGESCPCEKCASSDTPRDCWYQLEILTAQHVVFDQSEADLVQLEFSYYSEDADKTKITKKEKGRFVQSNAGDDLSKLTSITHDKDLFSRLYKRLNQMYNFHPEGPTESLSRWQAIVSHPHGLEKHVSFGKFSCNFQRGTFNISETPSLRPFTYETNTCPGSSGARVLILSSEERIVLFAHSGNEDETCNKSAMVGLWLRKERGPKIHVYQGALAVYYFSDGEIRTAYVSEFDTFAPNGIEIYQSPNYKPIGLNDDEEDDDSEL